MVVSASLAPARLLGSIRVISSPKMRETLPRLISSMIIKMLLVLLKELNITVVGMVTK